MGKITGGIILANVKTGEKKLISESGHRPSDVVISGDYVAWADESRQLHIPGSTARNRGERLAVDIFLMDLNTGEERRITDVPALRYSLSFDGSRLVWQDNRNEIGEHHTHYDIYAYDIETGEEFAVEVAPGAQMSPSISGDRIVWIDESGDSPRVMLYDFADDETRVIDDSTEPELSPDIHGDYIVWRGHDDDGEHVILLHDLSDGQWQVVATHPHGRLGSPAISDRYVVWTVNWDCDTRSNRMPDDMGVYVYDLEDGTVQRISNYVEPDAFIDGGTLLVNESCGFPWSVYAVFLG